MVGAGETTYYVMVVYDGSEGPFPRPRPREGRRHLPPIVAANASVARPITNETVQAFYRVARAGTPYNASSRLYTACADGTCDAACDGSAAECVGVVADWCNTPKSPCVVVYHTGDEGGGQATAADSHGLPPVNMTSGEYIFFVDVAHAAGVGPPP